MEQEHREIELFIHREGAGPKAMQASCQATLSSVLQEVGIDPKIHGGLLVFVGESQSARETPGFDDDEDSQEPMEVDISLERLGIHQGEHIHCHRCRRVVVKANYQNVTKHRRFSPSATVGTVTVWARKKFKLTDADADKLVLRVCGTNQQPRPSHHLGELVHAPDCEICFDLVFEQKIEG